MPALQADDNVMEQYWDFIAERQRIWYRRKVQGSPPPWTADPVLQEYSFTNIYRELDPGTVYAVQNILQRDEPPHEVAFNLVGYRLFGHEPTWDAMDWLRPDVGGDNIRQRVQRVLEDMADRGERAYTPAYMVSNYGRSEPKSVVMADVMGTAAAAWPKLYRGVKNAPSRQAAHKALTNIWGVGRFVAFQVLVDMCYPVLPGGEAMLPWSNDGWATGGPGGWRGLKRLYPSLKRGDEQRGWKDLAGRRREALDARGFVYLQDEQGKAVPPHTANLQNCCCEFDKYSKLSASGGGGRKRGFSVVEAWGRDQAQAKAEAPRRYGQPAVQLQIFNV